MSVYVSVCRLSESDGVMERRRQLRQDNGGTLSRQLRRLKTEVLHSDSVRNPSALTEHE